MNLKSFFRSKKGRFFLILFIIIIIFFFIFVLAKLVVVNSQCVNNPFIFAANTIVTSTKELGLENQVPKPLCSCELGESIFYFDHEGVYREYPRFFVTEIIEGNESS